MDDDGLLLSIGELARRSGLGVRTIRFWSDAGVLLPAERTEGGRRLYDAACAARLELTVTLRELGLGLPEVRRVLAGQAAVAEVIPGRGPTCSISSSHDPSTGMILEDPSG